MPEHTTSWPSVLSRNGTIGGCSVSPVASCATTPKPRTWCRSPTCGPSLASTCSAVNEALGRLRRRRPTVDWETYSENRTTAQVIDFPASAVSNDPERMMAQSEVRAVLERAIDEL